MPLEGLWWTDDMSKFSIENKEDWKWTLMIMQPEFVAEKLIAEATEQLKRKKDLPALSKARFEAFSEEGPTIKRLHNFIKDNGYKLYGKPHEIYLSDIRRTAPEKWKTIIRQPFR